MPFEEYYLLRLCEPDDAATIAPLVREAAIAREFPTPPEIEPLTEMIMALLQTTFSDFLLAEVEGEPVGCLQINYRLSTWRTARYAAIEDFYIRPGTPRIAAIRQSMVDYACQRADARECTLIRMNVPSGQEKQVKLYTHMGFEEENFHALWANLPRRGHCTGHSHDDDHDDDHDNHHDDHHEHSHDSESGE
jgi:hypothetical protein